MGQSHVSSDETSGGQSSPGALIELQAALFDMVRSANRCWLAIAEAQASVGLDVVSRIASATSGQGLRTDTNEDDISNMSPSEEVRLLHILE